MYSILSGTARSVASVYADFDVRSILVMGNEQKRIHDRFTVYALIPYATFAATNRLKARKSTFVGSADYIEDSTLRPTERWLSFSPAILKLADEIHDDGQHCERNDSVARPNSPGRPRYS